MDNQSYRKMEQKKQTVLDAIQKSEGNIDFYSLKETTGMEAIELFSVVEALAKENRILMRLNHLDEGTYCYKSSGDVLYERFMDLLFAHHGKRRSVAFYASRLCITPKYLCCIVKKTSGKTPTEWINETTVREIEYMLCHTRTSIKEIVYELGFSNLSNFGKFFKAHKGMSPRIYRMVHCNVGSF